MKGLGQRTGHYVRDNDVEEVIDKYGSMVYRIIVTNVKSKTESDDIFQEVFLKYMKNTKKFDNEEHRKAWLIRVTINCCKSFLSSSWIKKIVSFEDVDEVHFDNMNEDEIQLFEEVKKLPHKIKNVIILFYYEDMSIKDISQLLDVSEGSIKMRLNRGRKLLKMSLTRNGMEGSDRN